MLSSKVVRGWIALPLYVSESSARGEAAYVMADGHAYWERLRGASDLYHMHQVERIFIRDEKSLSTYNFVKKRNDQLVDRAIDYLTWHGVPREAIGTIPVDNETWFSSLNEAKAIAKEMPDIKEIVVVTSAPHTRRSQLCFQRTLPAAVSVQIYAPSPPRDSSEIFEPLWYEYLKLAIYYFAA